MCFFKGELAGVIVAAALVTVALIGLAIWMHFRRKKKKNLNHSNSSGGGGSNGHHNPVAPQVSVISMETDVQRSSGETPLIPSFRIAPLSIGMCVSVSGIYIGPAVEGQTVSLLLVVDGCTAVGLGNKKTAGSGRLLVNCGLHTPLL